MRGLLLLSLLLLPASGCSDDPPTTTPVPSGTMPSSTARPDTAREATERPPRTAPPPAFDAPTTIFDTVEAPPPRTFAPPRPAPAELSPPPLPTIRPDPPPDAKSVWGRCDVRPSEAFCFSYMGTGWTAAEAERHCGQAPVGDFGPSACPDTERIGTCTFERPGADDQTLVYTYYAPYPVELARLACPGVFEERD